MRHRVARVVRRAEPDRAPCLSTASGPGPVGDVAADEAVGGEDVHEDVRRAPLAARARVVVHVLVVARRDRGRRRSACGSAGSRSGGQLVADVHVVVARRARSSSVMRSRSAAMRVRRVGRAARWRRRACPRSACPTGSSGAPGSRCRRPCRRAGAGVTCTTRWPPSAAHHFATSRPRRRRVEALVEPPRRLPQRDPHRLGVDVRVGGLERDALEASTAACRTARAPTCSRPPVRSALLARRRACTRGEGDAQQRPARCVAPRRRRRRARSAGAPSRVRCADLRESVGRRAASARSTPGPSGRRGTAPRPPSPAAGTSTRVGDVRRRARAACARRAASPPSPSR